VLCPYGTAARFPYYPDPYFVEKFLSELPSALSYFTLVPSHILVEDT